MLSPDAYYEIDLGSVGFASQKHPFRVRLHWDELARLLACSRSARRLYELFLITRPGDLLAYLTVEPVQVSPSLAARMDGRRARQPQAATQTYSDFSSVFFRGDWDLEPEDTAWVGQGERRVAMEVLTPLFAAVIAEQAAVCAGDLLQRHIAGIIQRGEHPSRFSSREDCRSTGWGIAVDPPRHTNAYYARLAEWLSDPQIASVAYRGKADHGALRMVATEQRRRAQITGHKPRVALWIGVVGSGYVDNSEWDSDIAYFGEGLSHGDLFIEEAPRSNLHDLVTVHGRIPGRYILATSDLGDIPGFDRETGDGWWSYVRREPLSARESLFRIALERLRREAPRWLDFGGKGGALLGHEKVLVMVGPTVEPSVMDALVEVLRDKPPLGVTWIDEASASDRFGGIPRVERFDPESAPSHLDAILAMGAAPATLTAIVERYGAAWRRPTLFTDRCEPALGDAHVIEGDLSRALRDARAKVLGKPSQ